MACCAAAFVGKLSFADVVKSPARPIVRPLMSRDVNQQPMSRYVAACFTNHSCFIINSGIDVRNRSIGEKFFEWFE